MLRVGARIGWGRPIDGWEAQKRRVEEGVVGTLNVMISWKLLFSRFQVNWRIMPRGREGKEGEGATLSSLLKAEAVLSLPEMVVLICIWVFV